VCGGDSSQQLRERTDESRDVVAQQQQQEVVLQRAVSPPLTSGDAHRSGEEATATSCAARAISAASVVDNDGSDADPLVGAVGRRRRLAQWSPMTLDDAALVRRATWGAEHAGEHDAGAGGLRLDSGRVPRFGAAAALAAGRARSASASAAACSPPLLVRPPQQRRALSIDEGGAASPVGGGALTGAAPSTSHRPLLGTPSARRSLTATLRLRPDHPAAVPPPPVIDAVAAAVRSQAVRLERIASLRRLPPLEQLGR